MSLRRHVHLLLENHKKRAYSLHLLKRDHLFYPTEEEAAAKARALPRLRKVPPFSPLGTVPRRKKNQAALSDRLESVRLSPAVFTVRPSPCPTACNAHARVEFFPLSGSKIFFTDSGARTAFFDTEARCMITAPNLHSPKHCHPVVVSVPSPGPEESAARTPVATLRHGTVKQHSRCRPSLIAHVTSRTRRTPAALPLPPFLDGSGTHCFDTVSRTWSLAGDWQMPFYGKAEYVPELKLWLGLSAANPELPRAADLSPVPRGHGPKRRYVWGDPHLPKQWLPASYGSSSIISFGSGRFCITNFYDDMNNIVTDGQGGPVGETIVVFTGLEVLSGKKSGSDMGKGNGLRMIKHKSCTVAQTDFIQSIL
ncbi:uncharacterized protein [Triticum aestivum]|uniref:uncharacterized protein n=1 Tax=Triticum aestivum TaxID=4565 RepID=UPI001D01DE10|nr:uncharacterized protein LOC123096718 [Triticum aestivum]